MMWSTSGALRLLCGTLWAATAAQAQCRVSPAGSGRGMVGGAHLVFVQGSQERIVADDGDVWSAGYLDNGSMPASVARCRMASVITVEQGIQRFPGDSIASLRVFVRLYRTGQQGNSPGTLPASPDSSEELRVHEARVQIIDHTTQVWSDIGPDILAGSSYTPGSPWRDTAIANRWSVPNSPAGPHPGPINVARTTGFTNGHVNHGEITIRLMFDIDIDGGAWDVTHLIDECFLEITTTTNPIPQRFYPTAFSATGDAAAHQAFLNIGSHGDPSAMHTAGDNQFAVTYWEDSREVTPPPNPPTHEEVWTELSFDVDDSGIPRNELGTFRFQCEVYSHGWHEIDPITGAPIPAAGLPPGFDDSSEEWIIHDAQIQVFNTQTQAWESLRPWFDPTRYNLGSPWRDTPYARAWSRTDPNGGIPYPGPLTMAAGVPLRPELLDSNGIVRIRLWKDLQFDTFGNWDIVHAFDYAWLELQPRGVQAFGTACSPTPGLHPLASARGIPDASNGNPAFTIELEDGPPAFLAALLMSVGEQPLTDPRYPGCVLYPRLADAAVVSAPSVGASGRSSAQQPVPRSTALVGTTIVAQWFMVDPSLVLALSDGLRIVLQ